MGILSLLAGVASAPPKTAVSDNFDRADSLSLGANWDVLVGDDSPKIVSNKVHGITAMTPACAVWSSDVFANDQYSECAVSVTSAGFDSGPIVRGSAASNNFYFGAMDSDGANQYFTIFKFAGGSPSTLGSATVASAVTDVILRIEAIGTSIKLYTLDAHGGTKTQQVSVTDATFASGSAGIALVTDDVLDSVDDWYGGDI